jgi:hypothetical protein
MQLMCKLSVTFLVTLTGSLMHLNSPFGLFVNPYITLMMIVTAIGTGRWWYVGLTKWFGKFLLITNLMHFLCIYLFISSLCMFRASQCSSSGDRIVLIHHLAWFVCVTDWHAGPDWHTKQSLIQTNHTLWRINKFRSPDDEHLILETCREMKWINKYMEKKCIRLVINKNLWRDARSTKYKILVWKILPIT